MSSQTVAATLLVFGLSACTLDRAFGPHAFNDQGYRLVPMEHIKGFIFEVEGESLAKLGGVGSAQLTSVMESEMKRKGVCPSGYRVQSAGGAKGIYSVLGYCKDAG